MMPVQQRTRVNDLVAAIEGRRPSSENCRVAVRAMASMSDVKRAAELVDGVADVLRLMDEAESKGWPIELLKQSAVDAAWRIHASFEA